MNNSITINMSKWVSTAFLLLIVTTFISQTHSVDAQLQIPFWKPKLVVERVASLKIVDYAFPTKEEHDSYIANRYYESCTITGMKVDSKDSIYVSVPRWQDHVPATFAKLSSETPYPGLSTPHLVPFPSWEWNNINNTDPTDTLISVAGFEIDSQDRIWILDQGLAPGRSAVPGSIKLIVWDIKEDRLVYKYIFPQRVAPLATTLLTNIVINTDEDIAYITDSGVSMDPSVPANPGIIIVNLKTLEARRVLSNSVSTRADSSVWLEANGNKCASTTPILRGAHSVALSCDFKRLFWSPLTSRDLYAINTDILLDFEKNDTLIERAVIRLGDKTSATDGITCSSSKELYLTAVEKQSIYRLDEKALRPFVDQSLVPVEKRKQKYILKDGDLAKRLTVVADSSKVEKLGPLVWPASISFGKKGYMYFASNNFCESLQQKIDYSQPNFLVYKVKVKRRSYTVGCPAEEKVMNFALRLLIVLAVVSTAVIATGVVIGAFGYCPDLRYLKLRKSDKYKVVS